MSRTRDEDPRARDEEARARHRAYFETPAVGIAVTSPSKEWLDANDHLCSMLGYSREELFRLTWPTLTHPDDLETDVTQFEQVLRGEIDRYAIDKRFFRKDGTIVWLLVSVSCVRRPDRTVEYFVSLCNDIDQRKEAEEALSRSEAQLVRLLEGTSDGFGDFDAATGRVSVTPRYCELHGLPPGTTETTVESLLDTVAPEDRERIREDMETIAAGGKDTHEWEYRIRRPDGALRWIRSRGKVAGRDARGRPVHVSGSITDIHERKVAEEALRQSEDRFRRLFHEHAAVKLIVDAETGQIRDANKAALAFYGWPLAELVKMNVADISVASPEETRRALSAAREGRRTYYLRRHRRADGSVRDVEVFPQGVEIEGRPHLYSIIHDVTERRLAEEEKERVEAQNRQLLKAESLARMAAAIAHHFNNQLQVVLAHLELATDELPEASRSHEDLRAATTAARKAADLSRLMRTYLGQDLTKRVPVDLSEACARGLETVGDGADLAATLTTELASPGPVVSANPRQLAQLVVLLVTNAFEALRTEPREVHVSVATVSGGALPEAGRFPVDFRPEGRDYACLEVADSGCGIPEPDVERIFDPFFSTKFLGRGLGLAVALGITRSLHGAVVVTARPEGGTRFRVFLPTHVHGPTDAERPETGARS